MKWERGEQTGVVHPSMLLPGNFFLHMSAMSDSRTPFRTKRQRREGAERSGGVSGGLNHAGTPRQSIIAAHVEEKSERRHANINH